MSELSGRNLQSVAIGLIDEISNQPMVEKITMPIHSMKIDGESFIIEMSIRKKPKNTMKSI